MLEQILERAANIFPTSKKKNPAALQLRDFWSVRPIEIFAKSLYFQGFAGLHPLFSLPFSLRRLRIFYPRAILVFDQKRYRLLPDERSTKGSSCFTGHIIQGVRPAGSCIPAADPCTISSIPAWLVFPDWWLPCNPRCALPAP